MSGVQGTVQRVLGELAIMIAPLRNDLTPERAPVLFASLGLPVDAAQAPALASSFATIVDGIEHLFDLLQQLDEAVEADDADQELAKGIEAAVRLVEVIRAFVDLANAVKALPAMPADLADQLPDHLFSYLLAKYLGRTPAFLDLLELAGILQREDFNVDSTDPALPYYTVYSFHFDAIGGWFTHPGEQLRALYDWGSDTFDGRKLFQMLDRILALAGLPVAYDDSAPSLDLVGVELVPATDVTPRGLAIKLVHDAAGTTLTFDGDGWSLSAGLEVDLASGAEVVVQPDGQFAIKPPDATQVGGKVSVKFEALRPPDQPMQLIGIPGGSRISLEQLDVGVELELTWDGSQARGDVGFGGELKRGKLVLTAGDGDGFLAKVLSGVTLENTFDLGFAYTSRDGLHFHGSSTLEIQLASHIQLGPIELSALTFSIGIRDGSFPLGVTTNIKAALGPLQAVVEGIGFELDFVLRGDRSGNMGAIDLQPRFRPPRGVGLSIDVGAVKGGGYLFLDPDKGEYAGALELNILDMVDVKAIGLITTKLPDGSSGFSLLLILTAEFDPPFQLGYGLMLSGVGGLLGLNRTMLLQPLRDGVRTGAVEHILFPADVVANAPQIISDLKAIFPAQEGKFLIGPMAKLTWLHLVTIEFGLVIEIPGNIAILGVLQLALPDPDDALINIQVNFVGTLDFGKKLLAFDASLFDSRILTMTIEGDMALRIGWGDNPAFLLSVGGFHPKFVPPPLELPAMKRLAISIIDTDAMRLKAGGYNAITSNTVQFGCKVELYLGFDAMYLDGYFAFDALFQFSPFYFVVELQAGLCLHVIGIDLLSIKLDLMLEGPTPWHAKGHGSITILFWEISAEFDTTWGDRKDTTLPDIAILPQLMAALDDPKNWTAVLGTSRPWVSMRPLADPSALVLQPAGSLEVRQKILPLHLAVDKVGEQRPSDVKSVAITSATSGPVDLTVNPVREPFAAAQYLKLSDADKLSRPSFEPLEAGVSLALGGGLATASAIHRDIEYDVVIVDRTTAQPPAPIKPGRWRLQQALFRAQLTGNAAARSPISQRTAREKQPFGPGVQVATDRFAVVSSDDARAIDASATFTSMAEAHAYAARHVADRPELAGKLLVVHAFEVAA